MTDKATSGQSVQKSPELPEGLFLMDGIEGLRSLPHHSVDMLCRCRSRSCGRR